MTLYDLANYTISNVFKPKCLKIKLHNFFNVDNLFLLQGGFAKCYELIDIKTNEIFAGKIVSKKYLLKNNHKDKMIQEIFIHKSLKNKNIVAFYNFFEDKDFIYIVLELCRKRSMMELHKYVF